MTTRRRVGLLVYTTRDDCQPSRAAGTKVILKWNFPRPKHDCFLVAVASGPAMAGEVQQAETPKRAAIRMALTRYVKDRSVLNAQIRDFQELDAVSLGIARLFRATMETDDAGEIRALAVAARDTFVESAGT